MKYPQVDSSDTRLLVRSLGLLLNQASVYGPVHNVTKSATKRVYEEVIENLERYGVLEFAVKSNLICVNGCSDDVDSSVSSNLVRRFAQLDISGMLLRLPMPVREFEKIIRILAMPVAMVTEAGGVATLFAREKISSADVVKVDYKRVEHGEIDNEEPAGTFKVGSFRNTGGISSTESGVFDLSAELLGSDPAFAAFDTDGFSENYAAALREREKRSLQLAGLLRKTAESLERNSVENPKVELGRVAGALEMVRSALMQMTVSSESEISSFARDVKEDKATVAGLEEDARRRGCPLKLTREELLERYAEINQEIIQPLTVSTGVIEMLRKQQAGELSGLQNELLDMAHESILRVNELMELLHSVSGFPQSYKPDIKIFESN
jgi:hypothetical protein